MSRIVIRLGGLVELGIIHIAVKVNVVFTEDMTMDKKVEMNSRDPRTELWGTPVVTGTVGEVNDFIEKK